MDAGTLGPLAAPFPRLRFVVPAAKRDLARERIGAAAELVATGALDAAVSSGILPVLEG